IQLCTPKAVYISDGSQEEATIVTKKLVDYGQLSPLKKYENCYICRTDPRDVARVESKTFIVTNDKHSSVPHSREGAKCILGLWMSPQDIS
ncbi:unnamed protein product, partial [Rotaria socialis]